MLNPLTELWQEFLETANPSAKRSEVMTAEELQKQSSFESFDYYKPYPSMYMTHLREHYNESRVGELPPPSVAPIAAQSGSEVIHHNTVNRPNILDVVQKYDSDERNAALRWILHVLIAISVGVIAMAISYTVEFMEDYRTETLHRVMTHERFRAIGYLGGYFFFVSISAALVVVATGVVIFLEPTAAGGGIPDVIAYLNGVQMPKAVNIRTFIAKSISCMCAVAGGLPVGLEAPLIHLGAITGAGVTQGRSRTLGCQTKLFQAFRNNKDRRDFITAGAACGVSAAFGAPIGGLLFVMEEVSSFWDHSASGQIFLATMVCFTTISMMRSVLEDQRLLGWVSNNVSVLFEINITIPLNLLSIVPSFFLGILCGVFAAVFTKINLMIVKYRRRYLRPFLIRRFMEPLIIVVLYTSFSYLLALVPDCRPLTSMNTLNDSSIFVWGTENQTHLFNATCAEENFYAPLATLTTGTGKATIRHFFSRQTIGEFPAGYIFIFLVLYTIFACWSSGTSVSGGLVVPSLVIGAAFGRLYGQFLWFIAARGIGVDRGYRASQAWMDPGVFALIGAGAFFSGTSRMTMSICVIMVELSSELHYLLPVMVAIVMSKTVADLLSEPLYHEMLRLDSVPYLPAHLLHPEFEQLTAADVMASSVVTLRLREKTSVVMQALRQTRHHAFPVVEIVQDESTTYPSARNSTSNTGYFDGKESVCGGTERTTRYKFVGLVTREDVQIYLSLPALHHHIAATALYEAPPSESYDASPRPIRNGVDDGFGGRLAPSVLAINKMTWMEWLTHKTSLFFVIGDKKWSELWARTNRGHDTAAIFGSDNSQSNILNNNGVASSGNNSVAVSGVNGAIGVGMSAIESAGGVVGGGSDAWTDENSPFFVNERRLPTVLDLSIIVNRSPWVIPPFFNIQMAYHTFRMMGLRHMVVVDGDAVAGIITRKDLLVDALRRCVRELRNRMDSGDTGAPSLPPAPNHRRQGGTAADGTGAWSRPSDWPFPNTQETPTRFAQPASDAAAREHASQTSLATIPEPENGINTVGISKQQPPQSEDLSASLPNLISFDNIPTPMPLL